MTALAPASRTRAPEPHQHRPHAPGHPKIHSQMRLSDAPARGFHQAQPAQGCRPRPVQSHPPPRKFVATTTAIRRSTRSNDFLAKEPFSFTASLPTRSYSFFASFFVPQNFSSVWNTNRFHQCKKLSVGQMETLWSRQSGLDSLRSQHVLRPRMAPLQQHALKPC